MLLIFISLITGYIGLTIGSAYNLDNILGFVGFLSPTLFLVQRMYIKLGNLEDAKYIDGEGLKEFEDEDANVINLQIIEASFMNCKIGRKFKRQEVIDMVKFKYEINHSRIIPSDYCYNRMSIEKWKNPQLLNFNIFEYVDRGSYIYLGGNYSYNGVINYKAKGSSEELLVGEWTNGERIIYDKNLFNTDND